MTQIAVLDAQGREIGWVDSVRFRHYSRPSSWFARPYVVDANGEYLDKHFATRREAIAYVKQLGKPEENTP